MPGQSSWGSAELRLKNFQGWRPLLSEYMSQGCTTLPGKEFFLVAHLNRPGCKLCLLLHVILS